MLCWKISRTLKNVYNVEWFVLCWMICTTRWMVCTLLNDLNYVESFVLCEMICVTLKDCHYVGWFALGSVICTGITDYLNKRNIGVVSTSPFLKNEDKCADFVYLLD